MFPLLAFLAMPLFLGYFLLPFSVRRSLLSKPPSLFEPLVLLLFYISGICACHKAIVSFVFNIQEYVFLSLRDAQYFPSSSVSFLVKPVCTYCLNFSMQACRLLLQSLLLTLNPWTSSQWAGVKRILTL